ncbi:unnamed protein product [Caenorhabditis brenneri]
MNQSDTQTLYWLNRYWNLRNQVENENNRFIETIIMLRDQNSILKQKVEELEQEVCSLKKTGHPSDTSSEDEQPTVIEACRDRRASSPIINMPTSSPLSTLKSGQYSSEENRLLCEFVLTLLEQGQRLEQLELKGRKVWEDFKQLNRDTESLSARWKRICDNPAKIRKFGLSKVHSDMLIVSIQMAEGKCLTVKPPACVVSAAGGTSTHKLVNAGAEKMIFKIKSSNNIEYRISPVFGFVDPSGSKDITITRTAGAPEEDILVIYIAVAPPEATDAQAAFSAITPAGTVTIPMSATA